MNRPVFIWIVFGLCLALLLAAMTWLSRTALRLDRAQAETQRRADYEENIRLALWRMDSLLTPLVVQESSRPYFHYAPSDSSPEMRSRMLEDLKPDERLTSSPLLGTPPSNVRLYFQFGPDGKLTSPMMAFDFERFLEKEVRKEDARALFAELERFARRDQPTSTSSTLTFLRGAETLTPQSNAVQRRQNLEQQSALNDNEYNARIVTSRQAIMRNVTAPTEKVESVTVGAMKPLWLKNELFLVRRVSIRGQDYFQGCWLDWPGIRKWLLESTRDLLTGAELQPASDSKGSSGGRLLASLPIRLVPGELPPDPNGELSPIRFALLVAWGCGLLAAIAVGVLLHGAVSLSERRAAFVSAVTHELRTPLTTFRMYSEMLAEDMVREEAKRREYLQTLCSESSRLSHLVENVLSYARLERGRARGRSESVRVGDLVERVKPRLLQRVGQEGMELVVAPSEPALAAVVRADVSVVEQILFNLVDNACKYAAGATEKTIHLEAFAEKASMILRVRDHGPGIRSEELRNLFRPFSKSAHQAAESAPGVGLGLALCRRLSRNLGGDLVYRASKTPGACFDLKLPRMPTVC
jgi:two-component sensor histidine kinase